MVPPPEKRTDPEAGEQYTRDEFLEIYGGTEEWDAAGPGGAAPVRASPRCLVTVAIAKGSATRPANCRSAPHPGASFYCCGR